MGFRINTNTAALAAHASATMNNRALDSSLSKLNSGFRITSAADDASGMAIADSLRSQANALGQAIMNANDAIGVIQTADKAMDEQIKILDTIKTKAIQAAQDTQTTETRRALQADINRLMEQLDNIGNTTSFNGQKLLSGNFSNKEFQIGAYSNETIKASIGPTTTDKIGLTRFETGHNIRLNDVMFAEGMEKTEDGEEGIMSDGKMTLTFKNVDGINDVTLEPVKFASFGKDENGNKTLDIKAGQGLGALVEAINKASDTTGIRASANVKSVFGHVISQGVTTENFRINGVTIGKIEVQSKDANGALRAAINRVKDQTGVEASVDSRGRLVLANRDGRGIKVEDGELPKPGNLPGDGVKPANKPTANAPKDPVGVAKPSTPPKTPAQAIANANMHKTPTGAVATKPGSETTLDNINKKAPSGTKIAPDTNGRLALAAATKADEANKLTIADLKGAIEATTVLDEAAKRAQNNMTDALIAGAGLQPAGQSLRSTRGAETGDAALKFDALNMQDFAFESNVDVSGGVFGDADAKVGNLDGIRGATTLQGLLDEVRAGAKQLESNIQTIATTAGSTAIGNDAASAVAAQRLAVMMDRKAQLDGFAAAIKGVAEAWAQPALDETKEVAGKGVVVEATTDAGSKEKIGEKLAFKESSAASAPALAAGTPETGDKVSGKPAGQVAASELPSNHPAHKPASTEGAENANGTEGSSPAGQNTPTQTQLKDAAQALASATVSKMTAGEKGAGVVTDKISIGDNLTKNLDVDSDGKITGLDKVLTHNANSTVTYTDINTDLASTLTYIKDQAAKQMAAVLKAQLSDVSGTTVTLAEGMFTGEGALVSIASTLLGDNYTEDAITTSTLTDNAKTLDQLKTALETLQNSHKGNESDAAMGDTLTDQTKADKAKELLGKDVSKAIVDGWLAAVTTARTAEQGNNSEANADAKVGADKAVTDHTGGTAPKTTDFQKSFVVGQATEASDVTTKVKVATDGSKIENLGTILTQKNTNKANYTTISADLTTAGAFTYIKDSAKQAMAKNLEDALTKNADGSLDMSKLFDASNTNKLTDITESVLAGLQDAGGISPMPDSGTEITAITGAKTLKDLSAALDNLGKKAELQATPDHASTAVGESAAATVAGELAKAGAREVVAGWKAAVDEVIANATAAANPTHSLRSVRGPNESSESTESSSLSSAVTSAQGDLSKLSGIDTKAVASVKAQKYGASTMADLVATAKHLDAALGQSSGNFHGGTNAHVANVKAVVKAIAELDVSKITAADIQTEIIDKVKDLTPTNLDVTDDTAKNWLAAATTADAPSQAANASTDWDKFVTDAKALIASANKDATDGTFTLKTAAADLGKVDALAKQAAKVEVDATGEVKYDSGSGKTAVTDKTAAPFTADSWSAIAAVDANVAARMGIAGDLVSAADVSDHLKAVVDAKAKADAAADSSADAAEDVFKDPDYSDYKAPGEFVAPETDGADALLGGESERPEVQVSLQPFEGAKFGTNLVAAGSKGAELVDLRGLLDADKNAASTATLGDVMGALSQGNFGAKISDNASISLTQQLSSAIGNNIDGTLPDGVKLEFTHSIGGAWQHDNELLKDANDARNLADLRHALEGLREQLGGDDAAISKAPENPYAEDDAALYEDETADEAAAAGGRKSARALDEAAAQIVLDDKLTAQNEETARKTLQKADAIAQIDGWLGAIDEARLALDELSEEREDMGKSLADIIGLNTENSVNFGRLSLVGAGAKDIQLEITDAHGNDMTSAAGFDRDVHEKTVSLRETNAKTERDVAAAQGFNAEDWMDDDLGENANGYPAGVMTFKGAQAMIDIAETAQKALEAIRSDLGSVQNQLVVTVNNISVTQVNVKAAESNIRDVDFAQESATFSKHQILAQSGVYAMSQANAVQQNVMRLLQ